MHNKDLTVEMLKEARIKLAKHKLDPSKVIKIKATKPPVYVRY